MKTVPVQCRTHGGIFRAPKRPGRRPVKCSAERPCTKASGQESTEDKPTLSNNRRYLRTSTLKPGKVTVRTVDALERVDSGVTTAVERIASSVRKRQSAVAQQESPTESIQSRAENKTLFLAMQAKEELVAKGWEVVGEAWLDEEHDYASITATRDEELITALWRNGEAVSQEYSLWDNGNMAKNIPAKQPEPNKALGFDPDELSDVELLRAIAGQKVKWLNRISGGTESAIMDPGAIQIQHTYVGGTADENPGDRIIKFVDKGFGYRAFYVKQLSAVESP